MSLRVWLPLNGNLNNQGLSDVTVTNNGATIDNNGKIGKCYSFGVSKRITVSQPANLSASAASLSCWVNLSAWGSSYDSLVNLSTGTGWNDTRLAFVRNNTANRIGFCIANGSTYNITVMTSDLPLNTWTHLTGTFNGSTIKIYVNGVLNNSASTTFNSLVYSSAVLNLGSWSNGNNYPINGKLNDVRIYDHCLSPKEVKEISKGLCLHYQLKGFGQENLVSNSLMNTTSSSYGFETRDIIVESGKQYTFSANGCISDAAKSDGTTLKVYVYKNDWSYCPLILSISNTTNTTVTGTFTANQSTTLKITSYSFLSQSTAGSPVTINWYKLEEGSVATPWCPNSTDGLYTALGYNQPIEEDLSGYGYNGSVSGTYSFSTNSPRYLTCANFSKSGHIINSSFNVKGKANTISMWVKQKTATTQHFLFGTFTSWTGNGIGFYRDANQAEYHCIFKSTSESSYGSLGTGIIALNTWTHIAFTYNGSTIICYINGVEKSRKTYGSNGDITNPVFMIANSKFNNTPASENEECYISDVRFYATALSAEDILELYNSPINIDNKGNLYAYEFIEEDKNNFSKQGIAKNSEFIDLDTAGDSYPNASISSTVDYANIFIEK